MPGNQLNTQVLDKAKGDRMAILIYELIIIGREQYEFQNIMWLSTSKKTWANTDGKK